MSWVVEGSGRGTFEEVLYRNFSGGVKKCHEKILARNFGTNFVSLKATTCALLLSYHH
jgi:hypothetical protein